MGPTMFVPTHNLLRAHFTLTESVLSVCPIIHMEKMKRFFQAIQSGITCQYKPRPNTASCIARQHGSREAITFCNNEVKALGQVAKHILWYCRCSTSLCGNYTTYMPASLAKVHFSFF
jgi:hypothetical protein